MRTKGFNNTKCTTDFFSIWLLSVIVCYEVDCNDAHLISFTFFLVYYKKGQFVNLYRKCNLKLGWIQIVFASYILKFFIYRPP